MPIDFDVYASDAFEQIKGVLTVEAIYKPKIGGTHKIQGVFDDRVQEVDPDTDKIISSNIYTLGVKLSDLPKPPQKGDKVTIKSNTYLVIESKEDGVPDVSAVLILHKVVVS